MRRIFSLIQEGDSLTYRSASHAYQFAGVVDTSVPAARRDKWRYSSGSLIIANLAISGSRLDASNNMSARAAANVDSLLPIGYTPTGYAATAYANNRPLRKYILSVLIGTNDVAYAGGYSAYATSLGNYCRARKTAGFDAIIVGTMLPTTDIGSETFRQGLNTTLRTGAWQSSNNVAGIFDFGADPVMGAPGANLNTDYYLDGTHPIAPGYAILVPIYTAAINAAMAAL